MQIRKVVVGVDGSRNSDRAASAAADIAELARAEVVAVHAVGLLEGRPEAGEDRADRRAALRHELDHRWTETARRTGVQLRCELREGDAISALLGAASDVGADLIVVGRQGHRAFPEQVLGSTSAAVAASARCPVLVIPDDPASD
ncbi:MAG TPA: universal stress protein [Acidimicrobiales bacterium]|nr:universal stress protein [Acidimicrobiales bacterium]